MFSLTIAIPTFRRTNLLNMLLFDLMKQDQDIDKLCLVIIDGDPNSGKTLEMLQIFVFPRPWKVVYIPSPYPNVAFQRYLGFAITKNYDFICFIDDDIRILETNTLGLLLEPFSQQSSNVVGALPMIRFPNIDIKPRQIPKKYKLSPGGITPIGHRIPPLPTKKDYSEVQWLRGGVMMYKVDAIPEDAFIADMFAMCHIRCGLGVDDTVLSRRIGSTGLLYQVNNASVEHPNADISRAYPHEGLLKAYAATYSRRFLNDHYRIYSPPTLPDRWALVKNYAGNMLLAWWRVIAKPSRLNLSLARGTTLGAVHGLIRPPTAKRLTPHIDWWGDAEKALARMEIIQNGDR